MPGMSTFSLRGRIASDRLLGPYFLPRRLTGDIFRNCVRKFLPDCKDVDLQAGFHLRFMRNGAETHLLFMYNGGKSHL